MTATKPSRMNVYLLAGIATSNSIFTECKIKLEKLFQSDGVEPDIHVIFPYGDASRSLVRQVLEVKSDLSNRLTAGRIGGLHALGKIKETLTNERILLIGHSGGGAAAYQAAKMLYEQDKIEDFRIVQVGSPRTPIEPKLQDRVSYFHSIDRLGNLNDPISRIGTWGGWSRDRYTVPRWNRMKYAPGYVEGIPTVGGHADYFRHTPDYTDQESICNLDKTVDRVRCWLKGWV
ncbi:lipase family protein [Candidatus Pristimantibacillus sp. PTI5]|uniref:lipase family protein n=1 Tax=Candidatus Pristimantibacillus sp. PTI5 TaxID=3400422 RepID=UPI003B013CB5